MRSWQNSPRLADLLKIHFGIEVGPQDGKSSCVCTKCAWKICNAGTLFEFIRTALSYENTNEESPGKKHLKWVIIIPAQRNIKKMLCLYLTIYVVAQLPARKVCLRTKTNRDFIHFLHQNETVTYLTPTPGQLEQPPKHLFLRVPR